MKFLWISISVLAALVAEAGVSAYGVALPVTAAAVFYLAVVFGWRVLLAPALLAAVALEVLYGRRYGVTLVAAAATLAVAAVWRREGNCRSRLTQAAPGAIIGAANALVLLSCQCLLVERPSAGLAWHSAWVGGQWVGGGALLLPLICTGSDRLARRFGLPQYRQAQQQPSQPHAS